MISLIRRQAIGCGIALLTGAIRVGAAGASIGEVTAQRGDAWAIRHDRIQPLTMGDPVLVDDIVRTGPDTRLLVTCRDGLAIAIGGGSEVALRAYLADRSAGRLQVALGLLHGILRLFGERSLPSRWIEVDTRTALASVRSTEWLVEADERGTGVLAITGEVEVRGLAGGVVLLRPGEGTDVAPDAPPKPAARWGEARRKDAIARTSF
ncbi:FecR family protein [Benzoatithermus flavus]|uniref:FecR domain-containing protein n=1 Tax=Benzoatithermus flavus TaxID=3108223 RepID=A0ABU8XUT6_9PROT